MTANMNSRPSSGQTVINLDDEIADTDPDAAARKLVADALYGMALSQQVLAAELLNVAVVMIDRTQDTLAVSLRGDGLLNLHINPDFVTKFDVKDVQFFLSHEAYHILFRHLYGDDACHWTQNETMVLAREVVINWTVLGHVQGRIGRGIPQNADPSDPTKTGDAIINPETFYKRYCTSVEKKGLVPVSKEAFVASDAACYTYLSQIDKMPKKNMRMNFCRHDGRESQGDAGTGEGIIDREQAGFLVDGVLTDMMQKAKNGDKMAIDAMKRLGEMIGENHPMYGSLGLGELVGKTAPTEQVKFWEYFLQDAMASLMQPGFKLVFPRRLAGAEEIYAEQGMSIPFLPQGEEPEREVAIYIDCSGSMMGPIVERMAKLVGSIPNCTVHWRSFDCEIYPFEPGEALRGGGGTSFDIIAADVEKFDTTPDAVLVLTDGYAGHIDPPNRDSWIWLVTSGGDMWPRAAGMQCIEVDI